MKYYVYILLALLVVSGCSNQYEEEFSFEDSYFGSEDKLTIYYFWGNTCPICTQQKPFLDELEQRHDVEILRFEIYSNRTNQELFRRVANEYGVTVRGVPTTFIANQTFVGFSQRLAQEMEDLVIKCLSEECEEMLK
ncbi:MAG: TlpA family protein disulfide reductase [Candidatus Woesearchaeota archaeon]